MSLPKITTMLHYGIGLFFHLAESMQNDAPPSSQHEENQHDILMQKVAGLPTKPGIYIYRNASNTIIYVGKAKNLRNRVKSYFQDRPMDAKTKALIYSLER